MSDYIKKISLKSVESFLNKKLMKNKISIGADTASYHTAFSIIRTTKNYLIIEEFAKIEVPKLAKRSTVKSVLNNVDLFCEQLDSLKNNFAQKYKFDTTQIEDCYIRFNPKTAKMLAYNGILTYDRLKRLSNSITLIMPNTPRKIIGFKKSKGASGHQLKKEIVDYVNQIFDLKLKLKDNDIADSLVLALSGVISNEKN